MNKMGLLRCAENDSGDCFAALAKTSVPFVIARNGVTRQSGGIASLRSQRQPSFRHCEERSDKAIYWCHWQDWIASAYRKDWQIIAVPV